MARDASKRPAEAPDDPATQGSFLESSFSPASVVPSPAARPTANPNAGHRQRLRARFMKGGEHAVADYELLEMILFRALPRRDTKALAKMMLAEIGSFAEVINASEQRLRQLEGVGDSVVAELRLIRIAALKVVHGEIRERPVLSKWSDVIAYCRAAQGFEDREIFRILFLDKKNKLIADEVQQTGTVDHTPVYIREVVKRALEFAATALVLVHNHPSGDPHPSRADVEMTRQIVDAARPLGIIIHDHIIVGRDGFASLKQLKLMA